MMEIRNFEDEVKTNDHLKNSVKMKHRTFFVICSLFLLVSCAPKLAMVKTIPKQNDIIITSEMKQFSKENRNPSVVLRVPYVTSSISETERKHLSKYNDIYNQIEKNLLKAGFTVRDRGLLNNILSTGQSSYAEIGKKIETDIIIEILSIDFAIDNYVHTAILKKSNKEIFVTTNPQIAKLECKLTIVDKGLSGGILTLYYTSCTEGCDFMFSKQTSSMGGIFTQGLALGGSGVDNPYLQPSWSPEANQTTLESVISYFSDIIANILRENQP